MMSVVIKRIHLYTVLFLFFMDMKVMIEFIYLGNSKYYLQPDKL